MGQRETKTRTVMRDGLTQRQFWRITNDNQINYTHEYHNVDAFSHDGRYLAFTDHISIDDVESRAAAHVFIYDFVADRILQQPGFCPCWNPSRAELIFCQPGAVCRWDPQANSVERVAESEGILLGSCERQGKWALGHYGREIAASRIVRVALDGSGTIETIYEPRGNAYVVLPRANPRHDVCHIRVFTCESSEGKKRDRPGRDTLKCLHMMILGTDGSDPHPVSNDDEWHHHCWSGDGEWYMLGFRKKRWNARPEDAWQPIGRTGSWGFNHIGACGREGKFIVGDYGNVYTYVYDLEQEERFLMNAPMSSSLPYCKNADPHPTGSPDGTKYVFDSLYDFENARVTRLTRPAAPFDDVLMVESTDGFADAGHLILMVPAAELVSYQNKGPNRFYGCQRGLRPEAAHGGHPHYDGHDPNKLARATMAAAGNAVVPFEGVFLEPGRPRRSNVYVQVVRPPALPQNVQAQRAGDKVIVEWQEPNSALEVARYRIWRNDGQQWRALGEVDAPAMSWVDTDPPRGASVYAVSAVEHSGLESERSASAAVVSANGKSLPTTIVLPAESAGYLRIDPHTQPYARVRYHHDDQAYNYRAVECKDCENALSWVLDLPAAGEYAALVSVRAVHKPAHAALAANGQSCRTAVEADAYTWVGMPGDAIGVPARLSVVKGRNEITISAPIGSFLVDCLRLERAQEAK